jgi:hypothetical protein
VNFVSYLVCALSKVVFRFYDTNDEDFFLIRISCFSLSFVSTDDNSLIVMLYVLSFSIKPYAIDKGSFFKISCLKFSIS